MNDEEIHPAQEVKVLGVTMDVELRFGKHTAKAAERGINASLALKRIKGMSTKTSRQLYQATVEPGMDYALLV